MDAGLLAWVVEIEKIEEDYVVNVFALLIVNCCLQEEALQADTAIVSSSDYIETVLVNNVAS
jgi:hypothetical protein